MTRLEWLRVIIHAQIDGGAPGLQGPCHKLGHDMPFLRPSDDIDEGRSLENFFALELRHAPDDAYDKIPSSPGLMPLHFSQSGVDLLNGFFANAARVQYDDVRLGGIRDRLHALVQETAGDLFRVQLVHLASERLNIEGSRHGSSDLRLQTSDLRLQILEV